MAPDIIPTSRRGDAAGGVGGGTPSAAAQITAAGPGGMPTSGAVAAATAPGLDPGPVTVPVRIGTSSQASPSDVRVGRAPANRPVPRAEVRLSSRGRGWSAAAARKANVIGLASAETS